MQENKAVTSNLQQLQTLGLIQINLNPSSYAIFHNDGFLIEQSDTEDTKLPQISHTHSSVHTKYTQTKICINKK